MFANRIILNGVPIMDLTGDTAQKPNVDEEVSFHLSTGEKTLGSALRNVGVVLVDVYSESEMETLLTKLQIGTVVHYVGDTTSKYEYNKLYIVEAVSE